MRKVFLFCLLLGQTVVIATAGCDRPEGGGDDGKRQSRVAAGDSAGERIDASRWAGVAGGGDLKVTVDSVAWGEAKLVPIAARMAGKEEWVNSPPVLAIRLQVRNLSATVIHDSPAFQWWGGRPAALLRDNVGNQLRAVPLGPATPSLIKYTVLGDSQHDRIRPGEAETITLLFLDRPLPNATHLHLDLPMNSRQVILRFRISLAPGSRFAL